MTHANLSNRSKRSRVTRAQRGLASLIAGVGVHGISAAERLTRKRTENTLRKAYCGRWVAPAEEFARPQIARLESMILKLLGRIENGDLEAIDPALKIVDRLDRYHGFTKRRCLPGEGERARLLNKLNTIATRFKQERSPE